MSEIRLDIYPRPLKLFEGRYDSATIFWICQMRTIAKPDAECAICFFLRAVSGSTVVIRECKAPGRIAVSIGSCEPTCFSLPKVEMYFCTIVDMSRINGLVSKWR